MFNCEDINKITNISLRKLLNLRCNRINKKSLFTYKNIIKEKKINNHNVVLLIFILLLVVLYIRYKNNSY